jgi:hypothetical protein
MSVDKLRVYNMLKLTTPRCTGWNVQRQTSGDQYDGNLREAAQCAG